MICQLSHQQARIDFSQLDTSRSTEYEVDKRKLYGLKAYSNALQAHGKSRSMVSR